MRIKNEVVIKLTFIEEEPPITAEPKTAKDFAEDVCHMIADEYSMIGSMSYDVLSADQQLM